MVWKGVIIEESLENRNILNLVRIINTRETSLEKEDEKGILHFHRIELEDDKKDEFVQKASSAMKQGWYIHICKDAVMTIIFKEKVFSFNRSQKDKIENAKKYGISIGIVKEQMDIENMIGNPWD